MADRLRSKNIAGRPWGFWDTGLEPFRVPVAMLMPAADSEFDISTEKIIVLPDFARYSAFQIDRGTPALGC